MILNDSHFGGRGKLFADQISDLLLKLRRRTIDFNRARGPKFAF
jgi:hypothetical protein